MKQDAKKLLPGTLVTDGQQPGTLLELAATPTTLYWLIDWAGRGLLAVPVADVQTFELV